jgi:hypothetical protein
VSKCWGSLRGGEAPSFSYTPSLSKGEGRGWVQKKDCHAPTKSGLAMTILILFLALGLFLGRLGQNLVDEAIFNGLLGI